MEQASAPPSSDVAPARRGELRWLRRWLVVVGVWAVAASAVAIIALVSRRTESGRTTKVERRVDRLERSLDRRLSGIEAQLKQVPKTQDVSNLQTRLGKVETDTSKASGEVKRTRTDLKSLTDRVKTLEESSSKSSSSKKGP